MGHFCKADLGHFPQAPKKAQSVKRRAAGVERGQPLGSRPIADPLNWWLRASEMLGGDILSIRTAHISVLAGLPDVHRDPFDRMLIAQATAEALTLIASDELFGQYPVRLL